MDPLLKSHNLPVVIAVLLFVVFMICLLVIVDHKARIPAGKRDDMFGIMGERRKHPIWAWLTSTFVLWLTIGALLMSWVWGIVSARAKPVEGHKLIGRIDTEKRAERLRHFHNMPASDPLEKGKRNVCYYCHGDYPHAKQPMVRTLLNMHTQYVACATCHLDENKVPEKNVKLRWFNASGVAVTGKPFGTELDPNTGELFKTDDWYSKIMPFDVSGGQEKLLEITEDDPDAQEFIRVRDKLDGPAREGIKKSFHKLINPVGRFCTRCHAPEGKGYIPFRELGFSDDRVDALTNLNIVGLVQKYKDSYLPNLFERHFPEDKQKVLIGPKIEDVTPGLKDDPRTWWRDNFQPPKPRENANAATDAGAKRQ